MNLRIVKCSRGELVTGFRVQREAYLKRFSGSGQSYAPGWVNIGRKLYSTDEAREYRDFLLRHAKQYGPETLEVIEDTPPDNTGGAVAVNVSEYATLRSARR
jgi:hypothetical protein